MPPRLKIVTSLGMETGLVQLGDFVGSIFKNTNKLLERHEYFDLLDNMKFQLARKYNDVVDFAVCEVFGLKYRQAFDEYSKKGGPELQDCKWFTGADRHRIDQVLCRIIPEGGKVCLTIKDYWAVLNMWRTKAGTKWEYDGAVTGASDPKASKADKASSRIEVTVGPTGRRRVKIR